MPGREPYTMFIDVNRLHSKNTIWDHLVFTRTCIVQSTNSTETDCQVFAKTCLVKVVFLGCVLAFVCVCVCVLKDLGLGQCVHKSS